MNNVVDFERVSFYRTPKESPGFLLWHVSTHWRSAIEETLKRLNLTHPQFVILATVSWLTKNKQHVSQVEIGQHAGLDPNTTSQILRGLEAKNFIERVRSIDERSKNPTLTAMGTETLVKALPAVEKADMIFFQSLQKDELSALIVIFQKLVEER